MFHHKLSALSYKVYAKTFVCFKMFKIPTFDLFPSLKPHIFNVTLDLWITVYVGVNATMHLGSFCWQGNWVVFVLCAFLTYELSGTVQQTSLCWICIHHNFLYSIKPDSFPQNMVSFCCSSCPVKYKHLIWLTGSLGL